LAHWGEQFGIAPPDLTASRIASLICCLSQLPVPDAGMFGDPGYVALPSGAHMAVEPEKAFTARLRRRDIVPKRRASLSPSDFVDHVLTEITRPPTTEPPAAVAHFTPKGFPNVHLLVPIEPEAIPVTPDIGPIRRIVDGGVVDRPREDAVPPMLRNVAMDVGVLIMHNVPPPAEADAERRVRGRLAGAGVATVGDLLSADPDELHERVLRGADASTLGRLIAESENAAENVARVAADVIRDYSRDNETVVSRGDLADHVDAISEKLVDKLQPHLEGVPPDVVRKAVTRAVRRNR
jgi:hypothetical protein